MATLIWRGDAQPRANVWHVTPANVEVGDSFTITINGKDLTVTATEATASSVVGLLATAVDDTTIPEWSAVTATIGEDDDGNATHLILTGPDDGRSVTVTAGTTDVGVGVAIAEAVAGSAAVNEKQVVSHTGTGGTFTLTFDGVTSGNIAYNADAATMDAALEAMSNIGAGDVTVTGSNPWTIEFTGALAGTNVAALTGDGTDLTGGGTVAVETTTEGGPANEIQRVEQAVQSTAWNLGILAPGTASPTYFANAIPAAASVAQVQSALDTAVGAGKLYVRQRGIVTGSEEFPLYYWDIEFIGSWGGQDASLMDATCTSPGTISVTTTQEGGSTGTNEVQTVTLGIGKGGTWTITFAGQTTAGIAYNAAASAVQSALEALSTIGSGNVAVTRATSGQSYVYTLTFQGTLAATDVAQVTASAASITGGPVYVATTQAAAAAVNERQTVTLTGTATGGDFTLTYDGETTADIAYNASAATVDSALEALSSIGAGQVSVTGDAGGPWTVEFTGTLAAADLALMTGSGAGLTAAGSQTLTATEITTGTGPNYFNDAENWSTGSVPADGDTIVFEANAVDCLYGLAQSETSPAAVIIRASYTGRIGLPPHNGDYYEYLPTYLALGKAADAQAVAVEIGQGDGPGSGRIRLDTGTAQCTLSVYGSATPIDDGFPPILWKGTHASNAVRVYRGAVGIALQGGELATVATLDVGYVGNQDSDAEVTLGSGVTLGTVVKSGGSLVTQGTTGTPITALTQHAGETEIRGTDGVSQLTIRGGTVYYSTSGTLGGNTLVAGDGVLDFRRDFRSKTVTNPVELYGDAADVQDPYKVVSSLVVDCNETTRMEGLGRNVRITRGTVA